MAIVYTPTTGPCTSQVDVTMYFSAQDLARQAQTAVRHIGCGSFGELAGGGSLFIVGHGNAGSAIGTSDENYAPKDLLDLLERDGLPRSPRDDVTIHLYACATGTAVRTKYFLWRQKPYGEILSRLMAERKYNNYNIIAYCGFMGMNGSYSYNYHYQTAAKREWLGDNNFENAPAIQFRVSAGGFAKVRGDAMVSTIDIRIHPRGRTNSYVMKIRPG